MRNLQDSLKFGSRIKYTPFSIITNLANWSHSLFGSSVDKKQLDNTSNSLVQEKSDLEIAELLKANRRLEEELKDRERVETELKQINKEIHLALENEKKLNEHRSKLLSMASHELRTPLTTIMVSVDMLETYRNTLNQSQSAKFLNRIKVSTELMTELMNEILQYNRIDAGQQKLKPEALDLTRYCAELVDEIRLIADREHPIIFSVQQDTPEPVFEADAKVLRLILTNLLSNAIKYSPGGGSIKFKLKLCDRQVTFAIEDQGVGIPYNELAGLFEVFHRASNVGTIQGTGLGLAIVKKYVELHGGNVKVQSELNQGSTFTVTLPLQSSSVKEISYTK